MEGDIFLCDPAGFYLADSRPREDSRLARSARAGVRRQVTEANAPRKNSPAESHGR